MRLPVSLAPSALLFVPLLSAQEPKPSQDELLAAELASPFLSKAPWLVDFASARAQAAADGRLIFAYFTTVGH